MNHDGARRCLEQGLKQAQGKYIALLNADDFYDSGFIAASISALEKNLILLRMEPRLWSTLPPDSRSQTSLTFPLGNRQGIWLPSYKLRSTNVRLFERLVISILAIELV